MSEILCIYAKEPKFPATDQHPEAVRYTVDGKWIDAVGGSPSVDEMQAVLSPALPDVAGFITQIIAALGDPLTINTMMVKYPAVYPAIETGSWTAVRVLLADALVNGVLTKEQYAAIQYAATINNIPVTL